VISVISKHKVLVCRYDELTVMRQRLHLSPPYRINVRVRIDLGRKIVAELTGGSGFKRSIWFDCGNIIDHHTPIFDAEPIAWNSNYPLDQVWVWLWVMKHDDIAALDLPVWQQMFRDSIVRRKDLLVYEKKIAD